jgi:hypothetical protein
MFKMEGYGYVWVVIDTGCSGGKVPNDGYRRRGAR